MGAAAAAVTAIYVWRFCSSTAFCNFVAVGGLEQLGGPGLPDRLADSRIGQSFAKLKAQVADCNESFDCDGESYTAWM